MLGRHLMRHSGRHVRLDSTPGERAGVEFRFPCSAWFSRGQTCHYAFSRPGCLREILRTACRHSSTVASPIGLLIAEHRVCDRIRPSAADAWTARLPDPDPGQYIGRSAKLMLQPPSECSE